MPSDRGLTVFFWVLAIGLGAFQAWARRYAMNPDGVPYIDLADASAREGFAHAINAYWSPLYSWLLAVVFRVLRPSAFGEYPAVHLANFGIYLFALGAFAIFLGELRTSTRERSGPVDAPTPTALPTAVWLALAYGVFLWASLVQISLALVTPDLLLSGFAYLASALLLRVQRGRANALTYAALGVVLGLGYLAKVVMLPLAVVFLAVAAVGAGRPARALARVSAAVLGFAVVAGPLVLALSMRSGRLTVADSGRLDYAWHVNGVDGNFHWRGEDGRSGRPVHPTRRINLLPAAYEFAGPIAGTYPPADDPSYWHEGITVQVDWAHQASAIAGQVRFYIRYLRIFYLTALILGFLVAYEQLNVDPRRRWLALVPGGAALSLYALVYVEPQFVAGFIALLCMGALAGLRPNSNDAKAATSYIVLGLVAMLALQVAQRVASDASAAVQIVRGGARTDSRWLVTDGLERMGFAEGTKIGLVGRGMSAAAWARLGRFRIVSEVPSAKEFWAADAVTRERVIRLLRAAGADVLVAERAPVGDPTGPWRRLADSGYWVAVEK